MTSLKKNLILMIIWNSFIAICATGTCTDNGYTMSCRNVEGIFPNITYQSLILSCADCSLQNFTQDTFPYDNQIISFTVASSKIENIDGFAFQMLQSVSYLNLSYNNIKNLLNSNFWIATYPIKSLHLDHNKLVEIANSTFSQTPQLTNLSLNDNLIETLNYNSFSGLSKLENLNLQNNQISRIPLGVFRSLSSLLELNLANNHLTNFADFQLGTLSGPNQLVKLSLAKNQFTIFDGTEILPFDNLRELDLSDNQITNFYYVETFNGCPTIQFIHLEGNNFLCRNLIEIITFFKSKGVNFKTENGKYDTNNIGGIKCDN